MGWGISIGFHVVGLMLWVGGLICVSRMLIPFAKGESASAGVVAALNRSMHAFIYPGFLITLLSGLYQLFERGASFYMKQGWFHTKLTLVVVLVVLSVMVAGQISKLLRGAALNRGTVVAIHAATASVVVIVVFLTTVGRLAVQG